MGGADATSSNVWPPTWSSIRGYFTPATLFLVLNLVIGTIALTSRRLHRRHDDQPPLQEQQQQQHTPPPPAPLARTSSVLDRLRSFGIYRFRSGDFPPEYSTSAAPNPSPDVASPEDEKKTNQTQYGRSRSEPAREPKKEKGKATAAAAAASRLKKSSLETKKVEEDEEAGVDARADDFISRFRQQLQLQRLNSLLNYREMINRR